MWKQDNKPKKSSILKLMELSKIAIKGSVAGQILKSFSFQDDDAVDETDQEDWRTKTDTQVRLNLNASTNLTNYYGINKKHVQCSEPTTTQSEYV